MAGIPDSPANGYFQVKNVLMERNLIVDCKKPLVFGFTGAKDATLPPENVTAFANRFTNPKPKDLPEHPGLLWSQTDIPKPEWATKREDAGTTW